jgi:predicted HicB family RNase H-like nuclease
MSEEQTGSRRLLLTFRLDPEQRQRLKARLAQDGKTMSEVITHGLRQYVQHPLTRHPAPAAAPTADPATISAAIPAADSGAIHTADPVTGRSAIPAAPPHNQSPRRPDTAPRPLLPEDTAARLRALRASGRSGVLSATLAALHEAGWPLPALAEALGVSRQAIQVRVRQKVPPEFRDRGADYAPPPPFPRRREASKGRLRPHLTIKIDLALRSAAHHAAAREGNSLSQVVEGILDRYLRHGMPEAADAPPPAVLPRQPPPRHADPPKADRPQAE